jgi:hypothetical protein
MPTFEITGPNGTYEIDAPDEATALKAFQSQSAVDPVQQKATALADQQKQEGAGALFRNAFSLGLEDKMAGAAFALGGLIPGKWNEAEGDSFSENYRIGSQSQRILEDRARANSGNLGTAAEIGGTLATGVLSKAPAAVGALGRIVQTGKEAGVLGTIMGAGDSEAESLGGVAGDAVMGGGVSAATGGLLQGGLEVARPLIKGGRAAVRSLGRLTDNADQRAATKVAGALADDGLTPGKAVSQMTRRGTSLVNVADENTLGLARASSARPGEGRTMVNKALDKQQAQSAGKLVGEVNKALGGGDAKFNTRVADMIAERGKIASTNYQSVYDAGERAIWSPELERLTGSPTVQGAMKGAVRIWRDRAIADGFGSMNPGALVEGGTLKFKPGQLPAYPNIQFWDYTKRILDDQISAAVRAGEKQKAATLTSLNTALRNELDNAVPIYKMARQAYATPSKMIEALQTGRDLMKPGALANVDELATTLSSMSKPEKEMVRTGLARALEDMTNATPSEAGDVVKKIFGTPQKRSAIKAVFDNDSAFRRFEAKMGHMAKQARAYKFVRQGSRTSFVDAEKQAAGNLAEMAGTLTDVATGGVANTTMRGLSKLLGNLGGMDDASAAAAAKILVSEDPSFVMKALSAATGKQGKQAIHDELMTRAFRALRGAAVGVGAGTGSAIATAQ